jgi:UDP-2,3-diacylglucosamine pyrophosphatase LpxH
VEPIRIVISDLHIGQNDDFDIFASPDKPRLFDAFLDRVAGSEAPVELVINGDFVDFLQLRPWNDLSRPTAVEKIGKIVGGSGHVFAALSRFLRDERHSAKVLLGNHDVELAYPEVWDKVRRAILAEAPEADGRLVFFNTRTTYNPRVNGVTVHIEHGNVGDRWNEINYVPLFQDVETGTRTFAYPPGTKFVYETINGFKESYRFVDMLKPEMPSVPLILLALKPLLMARALPGIALRGLDAWAHGLVAGVRRRIAGLPFTPIEPLTVEETFAEALAEGYGRLVAAGIPLAASEPDDLAAFLDRPGTLDEAFPAPFTAPGSAPAANPVGLKLLVSALDALHRFREMREKVRPRPAGPGDDAGARYARDNLFRGDVKVVVFGHSHEALMATFPEGVYVNSGAWANLVRLPVGTDLVPLQRWLTGLADNTFERTSHLTFVRLAPDGDGAAITLNAWTDAGERELRRETVGPGA